MILYADYARNARQFSLPASLHYRQLAFRIALGSRLHFLFSRSLPLKRGSELTAKNARHPYSLPYATVQIPFLCSTNTCRTAFRRNGYDFFNLFWRKPDLFCRIHRTLPVKARYLLLAAARSAGNRGIAVAHRRIDLATSRADGYYLPLPDIIGNGTIKHRRNALPVHALSDAQIRAPFDNKRQHIVYYMSLRQNVFIFDFLR